MLDFRLLATLLTLALVLVLVGCPSEEPQDDDTNVTDDDDSTPGDDDDDDVTGDDDDSAEAVVLSEDTVLPEDETYFESVEMSEDELVFTSSGSGEDFDFAVGNVVVGCAGDCTDGQGYLRRVTAVEIEGATATLQTEMASLSDAVESGSFGWVITANSRDSVDLSGITLYSANNLELSIVSGTLTVDPTLFLDGDYSGFSVDWFVGMMDVELGLDMDVQAVTTASVSYGDEAQIFASPLYPFSFALGVLPVVGSFQITVVAGFEAEINGEASVTTGFDVSSSLEMGAAYYFGAWETTWDPSLTGNYHPPVVSVSSDASIKVYLGATASTIFYGSAGPSLGIEPYLLGEATLAPPPPSYELYAGISGDLGFELDVFSIELVDWETELFDWNTLLYEYTFAADLDGDGYYDFEDCDDGDVNIHPGATEVCDDNTDNDCDLDYDCDDVDCMYDLACLPACNNGLDDDADGWYDLDDPGCAGDPNGTDEGGYDSNYECNDGIDNDGDGDIDSADAECGGVATGSEFFASEVDCTNGVDDDNDGDVDCDDVDCVLEPNCIPVCSNGQDDDGDGWMDLDDPGCAGDPNGSDEGGYDATYGCNDGIDNDWDGLVDEMDGDCLSGFGDESTPWSPSTAIVMKGCGSGSYGWEKVDLSTNTKLTIVANSPTNASADCEYVASTETVYCSHHPQDGNGPMGMRIVSDPTGLASSLVSTDGLWDWVWQLDYNADDDLVTFTSTDFGSFSYLWNCPPTFTVPGDCDSTAIPGEGAIGGVTDLEDGYSVVITNNDGLYHVVDIDTGLIADSGYTAASSPDPALSYPWDIALDRVNDRAYILSDDYISVLEISPSNLASTTITDVPTSTTPPYDIILFHNPNSGDNEAWVVGLDQQIDVFVADDGLNTHLATVIPLGDYPGCNSALARSADGHSVFVSTTNSDAILQFDTSTYSVVDSWTTGNRPGPLAVIW